MLCPRVVRHIISPVEVPSLLPNDFPHHVAGIRNDLFDFRITESLSRFCRNRNTLRGQIDPDGGNFWLLPECLFDPVAQNAQTIPLTVVVIVSAKTDVSEVASLTLLLVLDVRFNCARQAVQSRAPGRDNGKLIVLCGSFLCDKLESVSDATRFPVVCSD
jgi:hypothetical protein